MYKCIIGALPRKHCCLGNNIIWVCVCSLRYPTCNAHAPYYTTVSDLSDSTIFFHIVSYAARFLEKKIYWKGNVFWFSLRLCLKYFSFKKNIYVGVHVKYPLFLLDCNVTWIIWTDFSRNAQLWIFIKIRTVGAELFHAYWHTQTDGRTGRQTDIHMCRSK